MADYQINGEGVIRLADGACIPPDPENRDWRAYVAWVSQGGAPDPEPVVAPDPDSVAIQQARHEAKVALLDALPEGALTQDQIDLLFSQNGDPIPS